jgi:hypothetical protein
MQRKLEDFLVYAVPLAILVLVLLVDHFAS